MKYSYAELAGMIDHALLHPTLTDAEIINGCRLAHHYSVASVCVKPSAVSIATLALQGSSVAVGTVVGFPHGSNSTEVKRFEAAAACADGATELDMVINIGKSLAHDFAYVEDEIRAVCTEAHRFGAIVKVIFENDYLPNDDLKIRLCQISAQAGADFVKTSTGFASIPLSKASPTSRGATPHDIILMRDHSPSNVQVKASGGIRNLATLIAFRELGATRCGTSATAEILNEYLTTYGAVISAFSSTIHPPKLSTESAY
jgi:deoxyribose-phosphate aldolase